MKKLDYDAVILSAGKSSRMEYHPKALLKLKSGENFLERIVGNLKKIEPGCNKIILVLGYHKDKILSKIDLPGVTPVENSDPSRGMLSSILTALDLVSDNSNGILLCLVDHPLVMESTYQQIIDAASGNPNSIISPVYNGRKGHPVYLPRTIFEDLRRCPPDEGARWAVYKNQDIMKTVQVDDPGIRKDIDTVVQYEQVIEKEINQ